MSPPAVAKPNVTYERWPKAGALAREMLYDTVDDHNDTDASAHWWNVAWCKAVLSEEWRATEARPYNASLWTVTYKPIGYPERWRYVIEVDAAIQAGDSLVRCNYGMSTEVRWSAYRLWGDLIGGSATRLVLP